MEKNNQKEQLKNLTDKGYNLNIEQCDENGLKRKVFNMVKEKFELNYKADLVQYTTEILIDMNEIDGFEKEVNKKALERLCKYDLSNYEKEFLKDIDSQLTNKSASNLLEFVSIKVEKIILDALDNYLVEGIDKNLTYKLMLDNDVNKETIIKTVSKELVGQFCNDMKNNISIAKEQEFKSEIVTYYTEYKVYAILKYLKEKLEAKKDKIINLVPQAMKELKEYEKTIEYWEKEKTSLRKELDKLELEEMPIYERIFKIERRLIRIDKKLNRKHHEICKIVEQTESRYAKFKDGEIEELEERISKIEGWMEEL